MTTLRQALSAASWQFLIVLGRQRGLGLDANLTKTDLIARIAPVLLDSANIQAALARLSDPACSALLNLLQAGGHCPARHLRQRHGQLRPSSQLVHRRARSAGQVDLAAFAPLEQFCLLGLAFLNRPHDELFIPTDLIPLLPTPVTLRPTLSNVEGSEVEGTAKRDEGREAGLRDDQENFHPPSFIPHPSSFAVDLLCHDLAYLLALLWRDDVSPLHGRWLPPLFLAQWGHACVMPPVSPQTRSELQTGRRRFIHYLAESAGLLQPSSFSLQPSPAAWLWLTADRSTRLKTLWDAWLAPDLDRWRAFRLPGHDWLIDPVALLLPLHAALIQIDPADPAAFAQTWLAQQPGLVELVPSTCLNPAEILTETVIELLTGPLVWLGVLQNSPHPGPLPEGEGTGLLPSPLGRGDRREGGEGLTPLSSPTPLRLTLQGHAWLTGTSLPNESIVPSSKFAVQANIQPNPFDSTLTLTLSGGLPAPADLVVAVEIGRTCEVLETSQVFTLTAPSFIHALHTGWSAPALLDALNRLAARPLSAAEIALPCAWADAAEKMTLCHAVILETTDPAIITRLASSRRGRALIHRTLSPRAVIVDPTRIDQLTRRLIEQEGVPPRDEGKRTLAPAHSAGVQDEKQNLHPSALSLHPSLWLAVQTYRRLGRHLRLPARIPQAVLDSLSAHLTSTDLAAADIAAEQVMADLRRALDGDIPFQSGLNRPGPWAEIVTIIERALAAGHNLDLLYYSPGSDTITRRVVEPYRIEQRGDLAYLVGFCQHAQAERMFRLDRVREIEVVGREQE